MTRTQDLGESAGQDALNFYARIINDPNASTLERGGDMGRWVLCCALDTVHVGQDI